MTFPFQFGVMFGDIGHGLLHVFCASFGLYSLSRAASQRGSSAKKTGKFRWALTFYLLMGLFAVFCGSLYNEVFAIPTNFWGSCWRNAFVDPFS